MMKRSINLIFIGLTTALFSMTALAGNGAPSGAHYNLNIIGLDKNDALPRGKVDSGHVIFVNLGKTGRVSTKIWLTEGDFKVMDKDGLDGEAAFRLPANDCEAPIDSPDGADCTNVTEYTVWIRALGKPGGNAVITTCRTDVTDTYGDGVDGADITEYCSTESVDITSETGKGKKSFDNVTKELTTLCLDTYTDGNFDGRCDIREQLFDWANELYWWDYDNHGLRLAQLRFYLLGD